MSCAITAGYAIDCNKDSLGGLKGLKIAAKNDIETITETANVISGITMKSGKKFYNIDLAKSTASFQSAATANVQNGTSFYTETVNVVLNKLKATTSALVDSIVKSSVVIIATDRNGESFLLGRENGLDATTVNAGTGTAGGDRNGYEITLTGEEAKLSHVDPTIIDALTAVTP